ncbi:EH domain-containing protein 1 [Gossypium raimondii]|uniref:EH domain-containing protein 1 n=1 Tax=Gossypium raimondii TaxID=29730 RepID=UPI002279F628|nr:EH domain-containing protein 1 [Gossypium raimondii]
MMDALLEMMQSSLLLHSCFDSLMVWTTVDSKRQRFLGFKEFVFAMQLVSLVQEGHQISHDLLNGDVDFENIRPPVMEGLDTLIMRKKQSSKSSSLESNGSSSNQTSPASQLFSSKSSKKES